MCVCVVQESRWEREGSLSRFQGSSSISSAEYFGSPAPRPPQGFSVSAPDLDDVRTRMYTDNYRFARIAN